MDKPLFEILAYVPTELGPLCLRRRELLCEPGTIITEVTLNHEFLMSSYLTASERALSEVAIQMHSGTGLDVLVGGLGLGYTAHAALKSDQVARCEVIEFLPQVIDWLKQGLVPLSDELMAESRLEVTRGDVYQHLLNPPSRKHDLILIDVDHSPDENLGTANGQFYTAAGMQRAKLHLAENGVLGVWSYAESSPFADALREVFCEVRLEPVTVFNNLVNEEQTDWLFFARD
ncbi:MAG: spermidine synthase [Planctomycetota bacterium]|nr:spermidine synthase [Planctomycetota bacterium]MDA1165763.1 spermidine synthase [Planctomycetota bacterium]